MARESLVLNISTGSRVDRSIVDASIKACAAVWVEPGRSIRNVTENEAIALRNLQAAQSPTLAYAELRKVRFVHPGAEKEWQLVEEAAAFIGSLQPA